MRELHQVVEAYVRDMQPMGFSCGERLEVWLATPTVGDECEELADAVHKFAGSAGQTGFADLSASAVLLEIALRAVSQVESLNAFDHRQIQALANDFSQEIRELSPDRSGMISGHDLPAFAPFVSPPQIILAGLPVATERVLTHVIEQKMGFAWSAPTVSALDQVPKGREPDLAIVPEDVVSDVVSEDVADYSSAYTFPVCVYRPAGLKDMTAQWGLVSEY